MSPQVYACGLFCAQDNRIVGDSYHKGARGNMNTCKTCVFWKQYLNYADELVESVGLCRSPKMQIHVIRNNEMLGPDCASIEIGNVHIGGDLATGPDFGCVNHAARTFRVIQITYSRWSGPVTQTIEAEGLSESEAWACAQELARDAARQIGNVVTRYDNGFLTGPSSARLGYTIEME